jgi:hypothetical protein
LVAQNKILYLKFDYTRSYFELPNFTVHTRSEYELPKFDYTRSYFELPNFTVHTRSEYEQSKFGSSYSDLVCTVKFGSSK